MSIELKIKSKHLSVEAQIIRFEENKLLTRADYLRKNQKSTEIVESTYRSLNKHRRTDVRDENRATLLARAYLAGKKYKSVEKSIKSRKKLMQIIYPRVISMAAKYNKPTIQKEEFSYAIGCKIPTEKYRLLNNSLTEWFSV